ncbi:YjiH family protein [Shewanella sp. D64]|uniref:YjiH family protein n=1 Tax=unclassified Shewanella TaxID=196818 RepID=UPI0022BA5530|nr:MULTISPECIES: YjiH family protein [unclassified Shewanella]MEC4726413.1 YjiH family protein [Shewanella sp. D64]MEC4738425.1 YjiH family protein [Shewanella sp. E94]WBJ94173.1 YjiH family protein [Shewanella sp. MTB7]
MAEKQNYNIRTILTFIIPSLIGLLLFVTPISYQDAITIPIAIISKGLQAFLGDSLTAIVTGVVCLTAVASILTKLFKPAFITQHSFFNSLLNVSPMWLIIRTLGAVFILLTFAQIGPEAIRSGNTGALVLNDLLPVLFCVFIFAGMLLPLLLNFGLLEMFGTLLTKVMRPVFNLPGRSAIDCMASWLGDGSVGILMTSKQYEARFYTQREAAVIGTTFSAVSITFSLVVISQVKLEHLFVPFYLTVCCAGIIAAVIVPKLPPLSWKKDIYIDDTPRHPDDEMIPTGKGVFSWGLEQALNKASKAGGLKHTFNDGMKNVIDMVFGVIPVVMAIGTLALIVAEYTPIFDYLGMPFIPLLELLQVPEAAAASKTIVVGFADMFLPSILASSIQSDMTRFIIAAMSVTQLIYMSEVGALLIGSKIPVNILELFVVFILRTLVTLPVIAGIAHLIF